MDRRLVPLNAFVALTSGSVSSWPNVLGAAGFRLEAVELPAQTDHGVVVVDAVAFHPGLNLFLMTEGKSGSNVDPVQARKYSSIDPLDVVRSTGVIVQSAGPITIQPVYICLADSADRVELGLSEAGCAFPLVVVGESAVGLRRGGLAPLQVQQAIGDGLPVPGPPPAIIRVDGESPDREFDNLVAAALVARAARGADTVSVQELASEAVSHFHICGTRHRGVLVRRVTEATQRICTASPENFEFRGPTATRDYPVVKVVDSPERADPRGRTQRYQAIRARIGGAPHVLPTQPEQPGLFDDVDLAAELEKIEQDDQPNEAGEEQER